jgi:hypothetical protein
MIKRKRQTRTKKAQYWNKQLIPPLLLKLILLLLCVLSQSQVRMLLRILLDIHVYNFSRIFLFFYMFQYVKLPCKNYFNKNGFRCNKISHFSTIILNKNYHTVGIYIFG